MVKESDLRPLDLPPTVDLSSSPHSPAIRSEDGDGDEFEDAVGGSSLIDSENASIDDEDIDHGRFDHIVSGGHGGGGGGDGLGGGFAGESARTPTSATHPHPIHVNPSDESSQLHQQQGQAPPSPSSNQPPSRSLTPILADLKLPSLGENVSSSRSSAASSQETNTGSGLFNRQGPGSSISNTSSFEHSGGESSGLDKELESAAGAGGSGFSSGNGVRPFSLTSPITPGGGIPPSNSSSTITSYHSGEGSSDLGVGGGVNSSYTLESFEGDLSGQTIPEEVEAAGSDLENENHRPSVSSTIWRNSISSPLSTVSLDSSGGFENGWADQPSSGMGVVGGGSSRPHSIAVPSNLNSNYSTLQEYPSEQHPSTSSSSARQSSNGNGNGSASRRRTIASFQSSPSSSIAGNYDLLLNRLEQQNSMLEHDPNAKRNSRSGNEKLRRSFERIQNELINGTGNGVHGGRGLGLGGNLGNSTTKIGGGGVNGGGGTGGDGDEIDWDFWGSVMSNYEHVAKTQPRELSRAIQKGIPPALRGMMWQLMSSSKDTELESIYSQLLKQPSPHEKNIIRDLGRTFPQHEYFQEVQGVGQENLFNVVKAYSIYDDDVGYCQGLQFIVGPLLLNMPDEEAFCVLVRLMKSYDLRSHFVPNMPGLQLRLFQFDRLLEEILPHVSMHLLRQGIKSSMYASQWLMTLFAYRLPLELVSSVLDLVFAEGVEAVFRFSVALMRKNEKVICELEFEQLLEFLKSGLYEPYRIENPDPTDKPVYRANEFVRDALQVKITPFMLDRFAEEYDTMCRQQNAHEIELDNLRQVNTKLSNQVRRLESSLAQINEEHCDLVKQVVMVKLEKEELEEELVKYKLLFADLSHRSMDRSSSYSVASSASNPPTPLP